MEGPTVRFCIGAIQRGVQPAAQAPFSAPGGDWLFFEATLEEDPTARFTVGVTQGRASGTTGTAWGKAVLAVESAEAGSALVRAVAVAFGAEFSFPRQGGPLEPLTLPTAVLGERLARAPGGGFSGRGSWTAAKWFLQLEGLEAEVYFNYDLDAGQGELTEKDEDYAQPLAEVLAVALRAWEASGPGEPRALRTFVLHRTGGKTVEVRGGKESYDVFGWEGTGASVRVQLVSGFSWDPSASRAHARFDPVSGALTPADAAAGERHTSPNGRRRWDFADGSLRVSETEGGTPRTLRLHPEEARAAEEGGADAFSWVSPRYLALDGQSYVVADTDTMRASLPLSRDARAPLAFSRSFQSALLEDEDGLFLARIQLPAP